MGLYNYDSTEIPKSDRIPKLVENLYAKMPEIESARAILITESYRQTENEPNGDPQSKSICTHS